MLHPDQTLYRKYDRGAGGAVEVNILGAPFWNWNGWGIYMTASAFRKDVSEEEHAVNGTKTSRCGRYLTRLLYAFVDMDAAKSGESLTDAELFARKDRMWCAMTEGDCPCRPDHVIDTRNGFQPLWVVDAEPTETNIADYKKFICGMIEWGKKHGSYGDPVKDVARLLRAPNFYHMKRDPYFVTITSL